MRVRLLLIVLSLFIPLSVYAGTVTFDFGDPGTEVYTTNAIQDTYLNKLRIKNNALRASAVPPQAALNLEQFVRSILVEDLQERKRPADEFEKADFCTSFASKPAAEQNATKTQYGNNNPCP